MTIRSWMVVVAIVTLGLTAIPLAWVAIASVLLDDVYRSATAHVEKTWSVEAAPKIIVDTFHGGIWIHPGEPAVVKATVEPGSVWKNGSTTQAENALKQVDVRLTQEGDTIRVVAKQLGVLPGTCNLSASTHVHIPPGTSLVLRTGTGSVAVSGEPSEVVAENQVGAIGGDFKVGSGGAPKVNRGSCAGLEVVGGSLAVGGRNRGTVSPGDHVELRGGWEALRQRHRAMNPGTSSNKAAGTPDRWITVYGARRRRVSCVALLENPPQSTGMPKHPSCACWSPSVRVGRHRSEYLRPRGVWSTYSSQIQSMSPRVIGPRSRLSSSGANPSRHPRSTR